MSELYYEGKCLIGLRAYSRAESKYLQVFKLLGLWVDKRPWTLDTSIYEMRHGARNWFVVCNPSQFTLQLAIRCLRHYMFLQMLQAQILELRGGDGNRRNRYFQFGETLYALATSLMRYVEDEEFLQKENAHIRTHCGVLM